MRPPIDALRRPPDVVESADAPWLTEPRCPSGLSPTIWDRAVTHPHGDLHRRLSATATLFQRLDNGEALAEAPEARWPWGIAGASLLAALARSGVPALGRGDPEMASAIVGTWLEAAALHRQLCQGPLRSLGPARLRYGLGLACLWLRRRWAPTVEAWRTLHGALGAAAQAMGLGPTSALQLTRHRGWHHLESVRAQLDELPAIRQLVASLGRGQAGLGVEGRGAVGALARRPAPHLRQQLGTTPGTARGLERTGDPGLMLPSEALALLHPRLRLLWHARRAERSLLAHRRADPHGSPGDTPTGPTTLGTAPGSCGPIIVCLDRSGSMTGRPMDRARALLVEALKLARAERRPCQVFAFSGPGELQRHPLALSPEGFEAVMRCLAMPPRGATDVSGPLLAALAEIERRPHWRLADVLLISDGRFSPPEGLRGALAEARRHHGVRVRGALVRPLKEAISAAMETVCGDVWRVW